jgi:hypothetical protein
MTSAPNPQAGIRLSPRRDPIRGGVFAILIVSLVIFGVLGFLGIRNGSWPIAVVGELLSLAAIALGVAFAARTYIEITAEEIVERGFWGALTRHPLSAVHSVVLARVYDGDAATELPQLIVRDASGRRLLRMRGQFWSVDDARAVADALGHAVIEPADPMTLAEFLERYRGSGYWFERCPLVLTLSIVGGLIAITAVVFGVMSVLELPIGG